jgi:orotidine-5'-phosphate decarboxylase
MYTGKYADKGAFILCKTSNKSSKDFQELKLMNGDEMYQSVAKLCNTWNLNTIESNSGETEYVSVKTILYICI